jgi:hypothetical protein
MSKFDITPISSDNKDDWEYEDWIKHYNPNWNDWQIDKFLDWMLPTDGVTKEKFIEMVEFEYKCGKFEINQNKDE